MEIRVADTLETGTAQDTTVQDNRAPKDTEIMGASCEMKPLLTLAVPVLLAAFCQAMLPLTSFLYVGRLTNAATLAGVGLGFTVCNVTGVCIFYGMGTGIEALCPQAVGAGNNRLVGIVFAQATFLTAFAYFPVGFLWYHMECVLLALGQTPDIAHVAGTFSRASLWGMVPYSILDHLKRCLQAQYIAVPEMIVALLGILANAVFHHITMVTLGMGVYGAGLAMSFTGMFMLSALAMSVWGFRLGAEECWSGIWSKDMLRGCRAYIAECLPGLISTFLEWSSIEASCFLAGLLGEHQLATQVMLLNMYSNIFPAALGISIGASVHIGNQLGACDPTRAFTAAKSTLQLAVTLAILVGLGMCFGREVWPRLYGISKVDLAGVIELVPVYAAAQMLDIVQFSCTGVLKGMGRQRTQAIAGGISFWLVAFPLSSYLALYRGWGVKGLWSGLAIAETPLLIFYFFVIGSTNWIKSAEEAVWRVDNHSGLEPGVEYHLSCLETDAHRSSADWDQNVTDELCCTDKPCNLGLFGHSASTDSSSDFSETRGYPPSPRMLEETGEQYGGVFKVEPRCGKMAAGEKTPLFHEI